MLNIFQICLLSILCSSPDTTVRSNFITSSSTQLETTVLQMQTHLQEQAEEWLHVSTETSLPEGVRTSEGMVLIQKPFPYCDYAANFLAFAMLYQNNNQEEMDRVLSASGFSALDIKHYRDAISGLSQEQLFVSIKVRFQQFLLENPIEKPISKLSDQELGEILIHLQSIRWQAQAVLFAEAFTKLKPNTQNLILDHLEKSFSNQMYQIQVKPTVPEAMREQVVNGLKTLLIP